MSYLNFNGKQISTMALNPPLSNKNNETDIVNGYIDQENNFELNYNTGINIKFQDIVYSIRRHILWDRCKFNALALTLTIYKYILYV